MNTQEKILDGLDPEITEILVSRRNVLRTIGIGVAVASVPLTFGSLSRTAFAQGGGPQDVLDVLNFALTLEFLENEFYQKGITASGLINSNDRPVFTQISKHEAAHVVFLRDTIIALGGTPVAKPTFDFTARGTFPDPFQPQNYQVFLALAQAFEDTGVRAYKGQAANLMSNDGVLQAALQIHSMEARHAAEVRRIRGQKGWITGNQTDAGIPSQAAGVYAGEENTSQGSPAVNVATLIGASGTLGANVASEAFDEPLTKDQVLAIAGLFIV